MSRDEIETKSMIIAHKIELDLNNKQTTHMKRAAGTARFAYNWALAMWKQLYEEWKADNTKPKPSEAALRKMLNAIKHDKFPWMMEVTKCAPQNAIIHLGKAFQNFFKGKAKYPKAKKKGVHDSFTVSNDQFEVKGKSIRIPKLGLVRMRERLRFEGKILSACISRKAGRWFVSIVVEIQGNPYLAKAENQGEAGVDLGVHYLAVLSTGEKYEGPKALQKLLHKLRLMARRFSRKKKGSKNQAKARLKLARLYVRIVNIRSDSLHQLTTDLVRRFGLIVIEDLNVSGMLKNRRLSRHIADMGFFKFKRQLEYKLAMRGGRLEIAWRFFPSSKICSCCGFELEELSLAIRTWECPECSVIHDRDVNAAVNLRDYALKKKTVSSTVSACGAEGSGRGHTVTAKLSAVKQEISGKPEGESEQEHEQYCSGSVRFASV